MEIIAFHGRTAFLHAKSAQCTVIMMQCDATGSQIVAISWWLFGHSHVFLKRALIYLIGCIARKLLVKVEADFIIQVGLKKMWFNHNQMWFNHNQMWFDLNHYE